MAARQDAAQAPPPAEGEGARGGVEVCPFDESLDGFAETVRAISELTAGEREPGFPDAEVERLASSVTFLREWRDFSYEPKGVSFTNGIESASSRDDIHNITLPQFSAASVPQVIQQEDRRDNTASCDFILFAGGNVWALDWCPELRDKHGSSVNCEYLAVAAHPPGSSYHKLGMPLIGRGIIQVWCVLTQPEEAHPMNAWNTSSCRGRPRKTPDGNNSFGSSCNPPKPRGRPRKRPITTSTDNLEPVVKRPRGRPRKYPLPIAKVEESSEKNKSQDCVLYDPLDASAVDPGGLPLAYASPTEKPVESTPRKGRGRPRKNPIVKLTGSSDTVLKEGICTQPSSTTALCTEPKRKRGRPRKYPVPSNSTSISGTTIEVGKDTTCQGVSDCNFDHTACTGSHANLSIVTVDAASTAICESKSRSQRGKGQHKKEPFPSALCRSLVSGVKACSMDSRVSISNDPMVSTESDLPSGQSNIVPVTTELCSVSMPIHILPEASNKRESSGRKRRGQSQKKSSTTRCLVASGANSPSTVSVTNSDKIEVLDNSDDEVIASNRGSIGSCQHDIEKCIVHLGVVSSDAASLAHVLCSADCKEESNTRTRRDGSRKKHVSTQQNHSTDIDDEEQKTQTTPNSSDHVASVKNCRQESCPRKGGRQPKQLSASNVSSSTSLGDETQTMESSSMCIAPNNHFSPVENPITTGSPRSEDMAIGTGYDGLKVNKSNAANVTADFSIENGRANEVVSVLKNSAIDGVEAAELAPCKDSREDVTVLNCIENSNFTPVPKDIALPRVVLCLAHNGRVAWDIKWKPPLLNQREQNSHLGFLAVLLGNGSLEVWEVPSPCMIQKIYSRSKVEGSDPRFVKLQPVFKCVKVKCGNRQSIPLTVDWSTSPHDMILAGCHDGTVALWNFSANLSSQDSKPFMCVSAESVPVRALSWAPYTSSEENMNTFVTAGEDGLKFWDLRDPYRPLWELTTAPRAVLSLQWLKSPRGIVISLEDGTLKFISLPTTANDTPVTGRPFSGTKTQGVSTYQLSEYLIWSVHASEITGCVAYCVVDGTAVHFQLTSRFWDKPPGKNCTPYFLCGSLSEEGKSIKIGSALQKSPLSNVPLGAKRGPKSCQDIVQVQHVEKEELHNIITDSGYSCTVDAELEDSQQDRRCEEQGTGAIVLAGPTEQENPDIRNSRDGESPKDTEGIPPRAVALHRVRWNTNKGSERWLCYGGAAGIIRCQRI
ncbi:hypothetical protein ACP70R_029009 [Stipagrostis hirtigluma subsp. patula]